MDTSDINMQIFKHIQDYITDTEFGNAQFTFFEKVKDKFEDSEENKLEYTSIFEEYVFIVENIIDAKLKQNFSEEQLNSFYTHFKDNYKKYEEVNADTVEVLFGFTDFVKFKEQILKFKVGIKDDKTYVDESDKTMQNAKATEDVEEFYNRLHGENCEESKGWVKNLDMKESEKVPMSCVMHMRPIEGSNIKMIRTDLVMKDLHLSQFVGFCDDFENQQRSNPQIMKMEVFEKKENSSIIYSQSKMPMMMSPRDSLCAFERKNKEDGRLLYVVKTVDRPDLMPEQEGFIRMEYFKASMAEQKGNDLHVTEFSNMDMKGYFPVRLMNMMMGSMMQKGVSMMYDKMKAFPVK